MEEEIIDTTEDAMEIEVEPSRVGGLAGAKNSADFGLTGRKEVLERVENYELPWFVF